VNVKQSEQNGFTLFNCECGKLYTTVYGTLVNWKFCTKCQGQWIPYKNDNGEILTPYESFKYNMRNKHDRHNCD